LAGLVVAAVAGCQGGSSPDPPRPGTELLGPELPVTAAASLVADQSMNEVVAFDGTNHLAVWAGTPGAGLRAMRFDASGRALDPRPLQLTDRLPDASNFPGGTQLGATFDGRNYLVVWTTSGSPPSDIHGARVSPDGEVLDPGGFPIADTGPDDREPAVAFDGTHSVVVWKGGETGGPVLAVRVDGDGKVVDPEPIRVGDAGRRPAVAASGDQVLIAWHTDGGIRAARLDAAGTVLPAGGVPLPSAPDARHQVVAFDGVNWHVAWIEGDGSSQPFRVLTARIGPGGDVLDREAVAVATGLAATYTLSAAAAGEQVLVAWDNSGGPEPEVRAARIDRSGAVLDPGGILVHRGPNSGVRVQLAPGPGHVLAAFSSTSGDPCCTTLGRRVGHDGTLLDPNPIPLSVTGSQQDSPRVASDGTTHLAAWVDTLGESQDELRVARFDESGPLDPDGITIGRYDDLALHAVAFDGSNFLLAFSWGERPQTIDEILEVEAVVPPSGPGGLSVAVVSPAGELLAPAPVRVADAAGDGSFSVGGEGTLLVWTVDPGNVVGAVISREGTVAHGPAPISPEAVVYKGEGASRPVAAFDGEHHLVVYAYRENFDDIDLELRGTRVTEEAAVVDPEPLGIVDSPASDEVPALAWNGNRFLLAWYSHNLRPSELAVDAVRLDRDGRVADPGPVRLSEASADQSVDVAAAGDGFLVVWPRRGDVNGSDVLGARVDDAGTTPDQGGFVIAKGTTSIDLSGAGDRWISGYSRGIDPQPGSSRAYVRPIAAR
jgi:hypothetical protein